MILLADNLRRSSIDKLKETLPQSMIISAGNIRLLSTVGQGNKTQFLCGGLAIKIILLCELTH